MKHGKRYIEAAKKIDPFEYYDPLNAMELVIDTATAKFDETVEVHMRMGVDSRHADQQIRGTVILPHGTGRDVRVLVFAKGQKEEEAKEAGADYVGAEDLAEKIQKEGWFDFDVVIATGHDEPCRTPRSFARSSRPDAESEIGHGDDGCRDGCQGSKSRKSRIPS